MSGTAMIGPVHRPARPTRRFAVGLVRGRRIGERDLAADLSSCMRSPRAHAIVRAWKHRATGLLFAIALTVTVSAGNAAEVLQQDGSLVIGTLLRLEDGSDLVLDTAHMGEVVIEWDFVARIGKTRPVEVELYDGSRLSGRLLLEDEKLSIHGDSATTLDPASVFSISPVTQTFADALEAYTDLGLNLVRGNNRATQASLGAGLDYETTEFEVSLDGATALNEQPGTGDLRRTTLATSYTRKFDYGWGAIALYQFERDEQQALEQRSLLGGGLGKRVLNNPARRLELFTGLAINAERFEDSATDQSVEALLGARYRLRRRFDTDASLILFPNLEQSGRYRLQFDATLSLDLVAELDLNLTVYDRYDSEPPSGIDETDYGMKLGLRWEY